MDVDSLTTRLREFGQEHLLAFFDRLDDAEKRCLYDELCSLDFDRIKSNFELVSRAAKDSTQKDDRLEALPASVRGSVASADQSQVKAWRDKGLEAISNNEVAVLLLAGGQGTRLNVPYPKGMYSVGLPSDKTLYQIQAERILKVENLAEEFSGKGCTVPWYVMTSEHTKNSTEKFFEKQDYLGLKKENIVVFEQNTFPCLTSEGKIILSTIGKIAKAPDGNGGLYKALGEQKILEDMERRGVKYIHVYGVDNILVKVADPVFVGFCLSKQARCGAKVVEKAFPREKVGVICRLDGKFQVVEYSEISLETAQKRDTSGHLVFNAGNICNHFFSTDFLKDVVEHHENDLIPHIAKKKIPYVDRNGKCIKPTKENGMKLEKFVFDVFQFTEDFAVLQVIREEEFSPLKNAPGAEKDTPEMAKTALCGLHYQYILKAGGKFVDDNGEVLPDIPRENNKADILNGSVRDDSSQYTDCESRKMNTQNALWDTVTKIPPMLCEISPLLSYAGEGLEKRVKDQKYYASKPLHLKAKSEGEISNGKSSPGAEPCSKKPKADTNK